jgi:ankyrin repeat protein
MPFQPLPFDAPLEAYQRQAQALLDAWNAGNADAVELFRHNHPRLLDDTIPWLPKNLSEAELRSASFDLAEAELALSRWYDFKDWARLEEHVSAVTTADSAVARFEAAVEAVVNGDLETLRALLGRDPALIRARSTRVTDFDPPVHGATLLHYVAANGVEGYRQKTPPNAVEIARVLLEAGAEADALAGSYGGQHTTMSMLVSSAHPAQAGLQAALAETLLDFGAAVEGRGSGDWTSPLMTALAFGYYDTAAALVRRGARVGTLAAAAGLGRLDDVQRLLPQASALERHRALALAAQLGHTDVVGVLLDAGEDPNRYNPEGNHGHATPLHQAALAGHESVVRLLVERGARLDVKDTIFKGTPLGWALYGGQPGIAEYLRSKGATEADTDV